METQLTAVHDEIIKHGEITLKPLFPKEWKQVTQDLLVCLPDALESHNIEVIIPYALPIAFKQNLQALVQEICYRNHFTIITVSEKEERSKIAS